jgi:hypothetical protein
MSGKRAFSVPTETTRRKKSGLSPERVTRCAYRATKMPVMLSRRAHLFVAAGSRVGAGTNLSISTGAAAGGP